MVGSLNLSHACEGEPLDMMSCSAERLLDSPDSGLPPSPSPSTWLLPGAADRAGPGCDDEPRVPVLPTGSFQPLHPLSFGEGITFDPLPPKEMRFTSCVNYDSDRRFIQSVALRPWGQGLEHCQQTIVALPHSTWRHYKTRLEFQPRHRPQSFQSTTIIYPKSTRAVYSTELSYHSQRTAKRFFSSVELEATGRLHSPGGPSL